MKAAFIEETGGPEVIQYGEFPTPNVGANDILVRVGAVAVNPIDTYVRSGAVALPLEFPYVVGCDLAGTVEDCGENVTRFRRGDRVWGSNQSLMGRRGSFAELASVHEDWLYPTPDEINDEQAAAGALVGITAHLGLFLHAKLRIGEVVFVNGGSGGVGCAVVQLARAAGARVITTAGSPENLEYCESLGADLVLDYRADDLDDQLKAFAEPLGGVSVWFETQREPTLERTISMMKKRGRIVVMAGRTARPEFPVGPFYVNDLSMIGFAMFNASADEQRDAAIKLNSLSQNGLWSPRIGATMPLSEAAEAHRIQEENTMGTKRTVSGKIVLTP